MALVPWSRVEPHAQTTDIAVGLAAEVADPVPRPIGRVLGEVEEVCEEEVTRAGLRLELLDQLARWVDGSTVPWRGRERTAGRGEAGSRLFFDRTDRL